MEPTLTLTHDRKYTDDRPLVTSLLGEMVEKTHNNVYESPEQGGYIPLPALVVWVVLG